MLGCTENSTKEVGTSGQDVPKRQAGLFLSPVTSAEANSDMSVEGIGTFGPSVGASESHVMEDMVNVAEELKHGNLLAPVLLIKAVVGAHNVAHLPFRSWCSARVRGRGLSLGHRKVDTETKVAVQIPTISVDHGFFGQPADRLLNTLPLLIVRDRKSKGISSHPVPSKSVTHPYPTKALMADLDFKGCKRVIFK